MKILITGGAGYVGSACLRHVAAQGHEVLAYDNLGMGHRAAVDGHPLVVGDIADTALLTQTLGDFGAEVSAGPSWKSGAWDAYVLARAGFVDAGDESGDRSYAGLELGAARPLGQQAEIGLYARYDISDADSFAREINQGVVTEFASSGLAVGAVIGVVIP